jgi:hypothetical protein
MALKLHVDTDPPLDWSFFQARKKIFSLGKLVQIEGEALVGICIMVMIKFEFGCVLMK